MKLKIDSHNIQHPTRNSLHRNVFSQLLHTVINFFFMFNEGLYIHIFCSNICSIVFRIDFKKFTMLYFVRSGNKFPDEMEFGVDVFGTLTYLKIFSEKNAPWMSSPINPGYSTRLNSSRII